MNDKQKKSKWLKIGLIVGVIVVLIVGFYAVKYVQLYNDRQQQAEEQNR